MMNFINKQENLIFEVHRMDYLDNLCYRSKVELHYPRRVGGSFEIGGGFGTACDGGRLGSADVGFSLGEADDEVCPDVGDSLG